MPGREPDNPANKIQPTSGFGRRSFLTRAGAMGVAAAITPAELLAQAAAPAQSPPASEATGAAAVTIKINGQPHKVDVDARTTLLDCLRETAAQYRHRAGCDHGQCGACTVHVNGRRVVSCLSFAAMHDGDEVTTIDGLGTPEHLHPLQEAFLRCDGYQCGYCTSGQIMSANQAALARADAARAMRM